jgi:hypothetical protein
MSMPNIHELFALIDDLYRSQDEQEPIPTELPPLPWDMDADIPLIVVATQLAEAYWLRYVYARHRQVIDDLRRKGINFRPYRDSIPWGDEVLPLYAIFDTAIAARKEALEWCFFSLTEADTDFLRHMLAEIPPSKKKERAVFELMEAMVALRTYRVDLWGNELPCTLLEIMQTYLNTPPYGKQGHVNETKLVTLAGNHYFIKTFDELDSGQPDPRQHQYDEAVTCAALRAFDWGLAARSSYHLCGADGNEYSLVQRVRGGVIQESDVPEAAQSVTQLHAQHAVLAEFLLLLVDRHKDNVLVDRPSQRLKEIDLAGAMAADTVGDQFLGYVEEGSLGRIALSHARALWEAHPETRFASTNNPIFSRSVLQDGVSRREAVMQQLARYQLAADRKAVVARGFEAIEEGLQRYAGDISVQDLENCAQVF